MDPVPVGQPYEVHPAAARWTITPGTLELKSGAPAFRLVNLRVWGANPKQLEHQLTIVAEVADAVIEAACASEPLYFGHVNYSDEFNLVFPIGFAPIDNMDVKTSLLDTETGEELGHYLSKIGDIVLHPVGICHWPGYMHRYKDYRPPSDTMRMRVLSTVYCASGPVKYNESAQEKKCTTLEAPTEITVHPDFADMNLAPSKVKYTSELFEKRAGFVPMRAMIADADRAEDAPEVVARVGETCFDLIVSAGGPKKRFASEEKSYLICYRGSPRVALTTDSGADAGSATMGVADMLEVPAGAGFTITGTDDGKRCAVIWFRKEER